MIEIVFKGDVPVTAADQFGLGRAGREAGAATPKR
jgi:hypothetical protein